LIDTTAIGTQFDASGNGALYELVESCLSLLRNPLDHSDWDEIVSDITQLIAVKGYIFETNNIAATVYESENCVRRQYESIISAQQGNKLSPREDAQRFKQSNHHPIIQQMIHDVNIKTSTTYNVSASSYYIPPTSGINGYLLPADELPRHTLQMYAHIPRETVSELNTHTYFKWGDLVGTVLFGQIHRNILQYRILKPFQDVYVAIIDLPIDSIPVASNEGMYKSPWWAPIIDVLAFRSGSNGNLSDVDAKIIRIRKNHDILTPVFEEPSGNGCKAFVHGVVIMPVDGGDEKLHNRKAPKIGS
jgi:hypothetical protein